MTLRLLVLACVVWVSALGCGGDAPIGARGAALAGDVDLSTFHASGRGDIVGTATALVDPKTINVVESAFTWERGHGIRIVGAGNPLSLLTTTATCKLSASGSCTIAAVPDDDRFPPDDIVMVLDVRQTYAAGQLELEFWHDEPGNLKNTTRTMHLPLPALDSVGTHTVTLRAEIYGRPNTDNKVNQVRLQCLHHCAAPSLDVSELTLVRDFVTTVEKAARITYKLGSFTQLALAAPIVRWTGGQLVYHDDSVAVNAWLAQPSLPGGRHVAAAGTYYLSRAPLGNLPVALKRGRHIACDPAAPAVFKNSAGAATGQVHMFMCNDDTKCAGGGESHDDIIVTGCSFDQNGANYFEFSNVIAIREHVKKPNPDPATWINVPAKGITISNNTFFDSIYDKNPARMRTDCELGLKACYTRQRQYIYVGHAVGVWVIDNALRGGGRIKVGGPGADIHVERNTLSFVNDNGIALVQAPSKDCVLESPKTYLGPKIPCLSHDIDVRDNRVTDAVGAAIVTGSDGEFRDLDVTANMRFENIAFSGNTVEGFFQVGILAYAPEGGMTAVSVEGNRLVSYRAQPPAEGIYVAGIEIKHSSDYSVLPIEQVSVNGNRVESGTNGHYNTGGIYLIGPQPSLVVSSNIVRASSPSLMDRGIALVGAASRDVTIFNNNVSNSALAVWVQATGGAVTQNLVLARNSISGSSAIGVAFNTPIQAFLSSNSITGNGVGLYCAAVDYRLTYGVNTISGNAGGDIVNCPLP